MIYLDIVNESELGSFADFCESRLITEKFVNLIGDHPDKHKYKEQLHDMIHHAYKDQGGMHGTGFNSPDDMVKNIPMWKLHVKDGKLKAAALYKDSGTGRKRVAVATDESDEGRKGASEMMKADFLHKRAHAEISGKSLSFMKKHVDIHSLAKTYDEAKKYHETRGDAVSKPADDDPEVVRHPELKPYLYSRKIGDNTHTKILLGTVGKKIT